jgi:uracil-DNA glycosylase
MPWTVDQTRVLRELGVPWLRPAPVAAPMPAAAPPAAPPAQRLQERPPERLSEPVEEPLHDRPTAVSHPPASPLPDGPVRSAALPLLAPPAAPGALAGLDWGALRQAVSDCRACGLCETRRQTVFGVGSTQAQWLIVGEAPGEQEDLQGEPFVGASGRLLDQMLKAVGLTRRVGELTEAGDAALPADPARQVYIANTLKCRPPGNRNPQPEELARCEPFLQRQLELLQPRIIVAMGRFAIQQLLRSSEPVGKLRGRVHRYAGVPLVVTYHPSYLLRNPLDKSKAWADWCLAAHTHATLGQP